MRKEMNEEDEGLPLLLSFAAADKYL